MQNEDLILIPAEIDFTTFYNKCFSGVPDPNKNIKRGQPFVAYLDEKRNACEVSITYLIKRGKFGKEDRVVFTVGFAKDDSGLYKGRISSVNVALLKLERNNLETKWKGNLEEAGKREETKDVVEAFLSDIKKIRQNLQERYCISTKI